MSAINVISLFLGDGTTTVDYTPRSITGEKATFKGPGAVSNQQGTLSMSLSPARKSRSSDHVLYRLDEPLVRLDANGVSTTAGVALATCKFVLPDIMTDVERKDLRFKLYTLINRTLASSYVDDLEGAY